MLNKIGDDDDLHEALELMQGGGGLFAPDLTNLELSDSVEAPIKEWLLTGPARLGDQRCVGWRVDAQPCCASVLGGARASLTPLRHLWCVWWWVRV